MDQIIRTATLADLDAVAAVEAACFPAAEAATRAELADRLAHYGGHFWLMFDAGTLHRVRRRPWLPTAPTSRHDLYARASCTTRMARAG